MRWNRFACAEGVVVVRPLADPKADDRGEKKLLLVSFAAVYMFLDSIIPCPTSIFRLILVISSPSHSDKPSPLEAFCLHVAFYYLW
jgi:hypothetical protein